jgi:hypothetical protein
MHSAINSEVADTASSAGGGGAAAVSLETIYSQLHAYFGTPIKEPLFGDWISNGQKQTRKKQAIPESDY